MNEEKKQAAFHEAGHTLLMVHYGFKIQSVEISYNAADSRWDGESRRANVGLKVKSDLLSLDPTPLLQESVIAFAGCLAQTRFLAQQKCHNAKFAPVENWDALFQWMENTAPETLSDYQMQFVNRDPELFVVPAGERQVHCNALRVSCERIGKSPPNRQR